MVRSAHTMHLSSVKISSMSKWNESSFLVDPHHLGVPSGASKSIYEPMARLAQTVHRSCTDTNTVSKRTETRFHITHSPRTSIGCVLTRYLSRWYIWPKQRTFLASRLPLSSNGLKQASTWASSPRSIIGWVQNDFWAYGMFSANRAPILHRHKYCLQTDQNKIPHDPLI
jgi:hypothetical protein